jgi:DNA-3-methyladenine glycosylase I
MEPFTVTPGEDGIDRCWWGTEPEIYRVYHDNEWGMPVSDNNRLFEKLCLEGFQSGLSWLTILNKRQSFREVFHDFDFDRVAEFTDMDVERLLTDARIIRHRGKIEATINNAGQAQELRKEFGSLAAYFWQFEPADEAQRPRLESKTVESIGMAKDLKKRGFKFFGPTTAYAFMQAMGIVNDHLPECSAYTVVSDARSAYTRPAPR